MTFYLKGNRIYRLNIYICKMRVKYPRSFHLSYSQKLASDDKKNINEDHFIDEEVIVTIKMDGENTTIYNDYIHARSLDSNVDTEDRRWIDAMRKSRIESNIPDSFRICGENMFYKHTCEYNNLDDMFYVFAIFDNDNCLSWDETKIWCDLLGLKTVPVIYEGVYDKKIILAEFNKYIQSSTDDVEGFVVRLSNEFDINSFEYSLNKYVRSTFVLPPEHWRHSKKTINKLNKNINPWTII